jgi:hypothetical protein
MKLFIDDLTKDYLFKFPKKNRIKGHEFNLICRQVFNKTSIPETILGNILIGRSGRISI